MEQLPRDAEDAKKNKVKECPIPSMNLTFTALTVLRSGVAAKRLLPAKSGHSVPNKNSPEGAAVVGSKRAKHFAISEYPLLHPTTVYLMSVSAHFLLARWRR